MLFDYRDTSFEIQDGAPTLAILPLAAIEPHGPHLPAATDLVIMETLARRVAERMTEPTFLLPVFPYGTSMSHAPNIGTFWLTADTLMSVVRDTVESLYAHGIQRVAVINNHGDAAGSSVVPRGNFVVKTAVRQLNYDHPERDAIWVQPLAAARPALSQIFDTAADDLHAGEVETSLLMHLWRNRVTGVAPGYTPGVGREYLDFVPFAQLCPGGVWGYPEHASADKGARALDAAVEATVAYIKTTLEQLDELQRAERSTLPSV